MSVLKNRKLERQQFAYKKVTDVIADNSIKDKEYKSIVEKVGMMVYTNGIISTLAHLKNNNTQHKKLYSQMGEWIKKTSILGFNRSNNTNLLKELIIQNSRVVLSVTKEILLLTDALKEMCKAEIND